MMTQENKKVQHTFIDRSLGDIQKAAKRLARRILKEEGRPACIVYLERGGMVIARLLCDELGVTEVIGVQTSLYKGIGRRRERVEMDEFPKRLSRIKGLILLVDDIADSGITMREVYKKLSATVSNKVVTCVGDLKDGSVFIPDYYDRRVDSREWVVYEYEKKEVGKELRRKRRANRR